MNTKQNKSSNESQTFVSLVLFPILLSTLFFSSISCTSKHWGSSKKEPVHAKSWGESDTAVRDSRPAPEDRPSASKKSVDESSFSSSAGSSSARPPASAPMGLVGKGGSAAGIGSGPGVKLKSPAAKSDYGMDERKDLSARKSSDSAGDIYRPAPKEEYKHRTVTQEVQSNILTAGSFDDRNDVALFSRVWDESSIASMQIPALGRSNWRGLQKKATTSAHDVLQLALVVDTTGSMGDELEYLKAEFRAIVKEVDRSSPGVKKEFAVVVYRDIGDLYVTRGLNFTDSVNEVQEFIDRQDANGGGDYPEAVHTALNETLSRLSWSDRSRTGRMVFLVADAPAHDEEMAETFRAVTKFSDKGISIFPVAASGVMDTAEAMMRATALMTGGQYIFLTDDSGVGNSHAKPKHPCYNVEKLSEVMIRMINDKISGKKSQALARNIIRSVGGPNGQQCPNQQQYVRTW